MLAHMMQLGQSHALHACLVSPVALPFRLSGIQVEACPSAQVTLIILSLHTQAPAECCKGLLQQKEHSCPGSRHGMGSLPESQVHNKHGITGSCCSKSLSRSQNCQLKSCSNLSCLKSSNEHLPRRCVGGYQGDSHLSCLTLRTRLADEVFIVAGEATQIVDDLQGTMHVSAKL